VSTNGLSRLAGAVLTFVASGALHAQDTVFVSVRGTAWDSLRNAPLSGAFIAMAGSSRTAVSDARGRFRIDSVSAGAHTFMMQHDMLDSIGFSGRSTRAMLDATHYAVTIAVPSFATLWRGLCGGVPPRDSGIVYGAVRDVADRPLHGAHIGVAWKDVSFKRRTGFDWRDMGGQTVADSNGRYALCGVPIDVGLHLAAQADSLVSAVVDVPPLTVRVTRRDFRLGKDNTTGGAVETGTVTGTLTAKGGGPMAGAIITVAGAPEVRSDDSGRFVIRDVPVGTRQMEVKAIGASPVTTIVDVAPLDTTSVTLEMGRVQTLEAVKVSAPTFSKVMIRNIEERKKIGLSYVRDSTEIRKLPHMVAVIDGVPGVVVCRGRLGAFFIGLNDSCKAPRCQIPVWIDRMNLDAAAYSTLRPEDIATVEVFSPMRGATSIPPEFTDRRKPCGAIVVWTKHSLRQ